jgi:hypothetical protein
VLKKVACSNAGGFFKKQFKSAIKFSELNHQVLKSPQKDVSPINEITSIE